MAPRLRIRDEIGLRVVALDRPSVTIGRRTETDIRVVGGGVSRLHAEIITVNGATTLKDCGSKFGTYVRGERVTQILLTHGDRIRLGQTDDNEITFLVGDDDSRIGVDQERSAVTAATELLSHMARLLEGLRALGSGRVLDDVLTLVIDSAIEVTGAERGFIMLANHRGELEFKLARARGHVSLSGRTFETSRKVPEQVFATGQETIVDDLLDGNLAQQHTGTVALGIRNVLCTPLRLVRYVERREEASEERIIGVLYLDSRQRGALRPPSVSAALAALSTEAAMAIENARLYREALDKAKFEQELKVAAAIQQSLLPMASRTGTFFTTAGRSVPCRAVGGDFFDYVDLPAGGFGFILGDVAGKGAPAALLAAAVLGMFSAEATYQQSAASVMARLNAGLFRRAIEARFLTSFYGMLGKDGSFTYSNAGHNAPMLVSSSGGVRRLETGGLVLGLFENAIFEQETLTLNRGDFIIIFSDGVTEALDMEGTEFTDQRLLASIEAHRQDPPEALLDALLADVRTFCGEATANDDVTIVVVRYDG